MMKKGKRIAATLGAIAIAMQTSSCGMLMSWPFNTMGNTSSSSSSEVSSALSSSVDSASPSSAAASSEPEEKAISFGTEAMLNNWAVTVNGVDYVNSIDDGSFRTFTPDEGSKFARVNLTVTNKGSEMDTFFPAYSFYADVDAAIFYGENREYEYSPSNLLGYSDDLHDTTLNPLASASGIIVFDIPETVVNDTETPLYFVLSDGADELTFSLRK